MKLPRVEYGQVQSLGRSDSGAVQQAAAVAGQTGQIQQEMAGIIAESGQNYIRRKQDSEYNNTVASTQIQMNAWVAEYGAKDFFTSEELGAINSDLVPRTDTSTDGTGVTVTAVRDDIPAHEVYPLMLKQKLDGLTADMAEKISNPHMREQYLNQAQLANSNMLMQATLAAENQQQAYIFAENKYNIDKAGKTGNLEEGLFLIENMEASELVKKGLTDKLLTDDEMYDVIGASRSNNQETVMSMRSMLMDPGYGGYLSNGQRSAAIADMDHQLTMLGLEGVQDRATQQDIRDNNRLYSAGMGNMTHEEVEAGYELWQADPKHKDAINVDKRLQLHGAIEAYDSAIDVENRRVQSEMEAAQTKAQKEEYASYYSDLNRALDSGEITAHAQIESIYEMGQEMALEGQSGPALKPADRTAMHRRLDTINKEGAKIAEYETMIAGALSGEYPLRRTNPKHVKAVEHFVDVSGLTRDSVEQLGVLTKLTGIMPDNLRDEVEGGLLSGNMEQGVAALTYIENLQRSGSHLTSVLSEDTMDLANYANLLVRGGSEPEQALKQAKQMSEDLTYEMKQFYRDAYKTAKVDNVKGLSDQLDADSTFDFEWGWNKDIAVPSGMQAEYNAMVQQSYAFAKGDPKLAQKLAYKNIKAQWSVTGVGVSPMGVPGMRASKLAPEKVLQRSTKSVNLGLEAWALVEGIDSEDVYLANDKGTLQDHGWTVWVIDPDTGESDIYDERWLADEWITQAVSVYDQQSMKNSHENMVQRGNDFLESGTTLNADRIAGRDLQ